MCRQLRKEGFNEDNPSHLCEEITIDAAKFTVNYIKKNM